MRDLKCELEIIKKYDVWAMNFPVDWVTELLSRAIAAEAALADKTEECERLRKALAEIGNVTEEAGYCYDGTREAVSRISVVAEDALKGGAE